MTQMFDILRTTVAGGNPIVLVAVAFLAGIATSFTPCMYPMIPITMGILQAQSSFSIWSNFFMALSYVLGMAMVYASLGYVAATSSVIFGKWAANPWFVLIAVIIFLYLAGSMFGFYEVYLPSFLTKHHEVSQRRSFIRSFIFGVLSGTVASPCLTPPLAILLTFVAKRGSPVVGFAVLLAFALGMGMLLLVVGTFSSSLSLLPRAGSWMLEVKKFFGFIMVAMCVYLARPVIGDVWSMYLYGCVGIIVVGYYAVAFINWFRAK